MPGNRSKICFGVVVTSEHRHFSVLDLLVICLEKIWVLQIIWSIKSKYS